ncbi:hypothetical protein JCM10213_008432 [Rhodosporidiobolus nylandii]
MARRLPVELELYILELALSPIKWWTTGHRDAVIECRERLKRFSLVDRAWTRVAQRELFSFLRISVPLRTALRAGVERSKAISRKGWRVRALELVVPDEVRKVYGKNWEYVLAVRARLQPVAEAVQELSLQWRWRGEDTDLLRDFLDLKRLSLFASGDMGEIFAVSFVPSTLTYLHLRGVDYADYDDPFPILPHLEVLLLEHLDLTGSDLTLDVLLSTPALRVFACKNICSIGEELSDVLSSAPSTLEHVLLAITAGDEPDDFLGAVDALPSAPKTLMVVVDNHAIMDEDAREMLMEWCCAKEVKGRIQKVESVGTFDLAGWAAELA